MTRHRLVVDDDYEFLTFGISCHLKDFRVAWHINQLFGFDMVRGHIAPEGRDHAVFRHLDPDNHLRYVLLNNHSENIPLVKPYKQFNLFMLVEGYVDLFDSERFAETLRRNEAFQLVMEISSDPLKKFQFTLFED